MKYNFKLFAEVKHAIKFYINVIIVGLTFGTYKISIDLIAKVSYTSISKYWWPE